MGQQSKKQLIAKHNKLTKKAKNETTINYKMNDDNFYMNKGVQPLNRASDYFTNWRHRLLSNEIVCKLSDYPKDEDDDIYIPLIVESNWPHTPNPNKSDAEKLKFVQRCFGDIVFNELSFDDFVHFIGKWHSYHFWTYHSRTKQNKKKCHFNKRISAIYESINEQIKQSYFNFLTAELEFRSFVVFGNKKLLKTQRSSHIFSFSLFSIKRRMDKIQNVILQIDLSQIHILSNLAILRLTQSIRECIAMCDALYDDIKQTKQNIVNHLHHFCNNLNDKILHTVINKIKQCKITKNNTMPITPLIYVYDGNEVHIDLELCDFAEFVNYYRYILTVLEECKIKINKNETALHHFLKYVGGEIEGSIWNKMIWKERECQKRVKRDEQISKRLLFLRNQRQKSNNLMNVSNADLMKKIFDIQSAMDLYCKQKLNDSDIEAHSLAVHIRLNLLNNDEFVRSTLYNQMYEAVHDRDRPRGAKPIASLQKIIADNLAKEQ